MGCDIHEYYEIRSGFGQPWQHHDFRMPFLQRNAYGPG